MGNMSYCRFRNTYRDLIDCMSSMRDDLTGEEFAARKAMIALCREIVEIHGELEDEEEVTEEAEQGENQGNALMDFDAIRKSYP